MRGGLAHSFFGVEALSLYRKLEKRNPFFLKELRFGSYVFAGVRFKSFRKHQAFRATRTIQVKVVKVAPKGFSSTDELGVGSDSTETTASTAGVASCEGGPNAVTRLLVLDEVPFFQLFHIRI